MDFFSCELRNLLMDKGMRIPSVIIENPLKKLRLTYQLTRGMELIIRARIMNIFQTLSLGDLSLRSEYMMQKNIRPVRKYSGSWRSEFFEPYEEILLGIKVRIRRIVDVEDFLGSSGCDCEDIYWYWGWILILRDQ